MVICHYQIHSCKFEYALSIFIYKWPTYDFDGDRIKLISLLSTHQLKLQPHRFPSVTSGSPCVIYVFKQF